MSISTDKTAPSKPFVPRFPIWLPAPNPFSVIPFVFVLCLFAAPLIWFPFDVESCWLPWSRASDGVAPWRIYLSRNDCNYPPLVLYLLTIQEAIRRQLGADEMGSMSLVLTKLPNIIAHLAGAVIGYLSLRKITNETYARQFALLYALSLAIFVNSALWGQADALLTLPMLCAVLFLMRDKPIPAGIALGIALTIKLQAVVIAPVLLVYAFRKFGWKPMGLAVLAGIATILLISLPHIIGGAMTPMVKAYTDAAGYYPFRTLNTFNLWSLLNYVDEYKRHVPGNIVNNDNRFAFAHFTYRDVSVFLFVLALGFLLSCIWRRPTMRTLAWTASFSVLTFVTLCTQMHERYWVPGAALLLLVAPESWFALILATLFGLTAAWNQWLVLISNFKAYHPVPDFVQWTLEAGWGPSLVNISALNLVLLSMGMGFCGSLAEEVDEEPDPPDA